MRFISLSAALILLGCAEPTLESIQKDYQIKPIGKGSFSAVAEVRDNHESLQDRLSINAFSFFCGGTPKMLQKKSVEPFMKDVTVTTRVWHAPSQSMQQIASYPHPEAHVRIRYEFSC
jgi:hypothetical protein